MRMHPILRTVALATTALSVLPSFRPSVLSAQKTSERYTKQFVMVPMRDGTKLNTEIYIPKTGDGRRAMVLTRTPYGLGHDADGFSPAMATQYKELAEDGYIFVFQDIRGRFKSEGPFVMMRNPRDPKDAKAIDEGTDTYDTIDWMLKNVPGNNGRVGMLGISYGGWLTVMGILEPHPALKVASPQASPIDMWMGDDFHHNGAFRLAYGFEYAAMMEAGKEIKLFEFDEYDGFEWYLKLGSLANVNPKYLGGKIPTWNDYANHPNYDTFWQKQSVKGYLNKVTVPTLNVAGWWDQEDFYGPVEIYETLEKHDIKSQNLLVVGPWNHGGWARGDGDQLGKIKFGGTAPSKYYREQVQRPYFAHYLKDGPDPKLPEALVYETGANKWVSYNTWPPKTVTTERKVYFRDGGKLSFEAPTDADDNAHDAYVADPAKPVPYRARPIPSTFGPGSTWGAWLVDDQRHAHLRPDVLSWESEPLSDDIVVSGHILANLFLSTSGTDGDWIVKLIDAYPETGQEGAMNGYQLMVANEVMRARFRNSWEKPEALVPGQTFPLTVDMRNMNHRFKKGHRIMVQVQSSWFPLIDRNPQTFVPNIFEAKESDFRAATQRVFRSGKFASNVALPVVQGGLTP